MLNEKNWPITLRHFQHMSEETPPKGSSINDVTHFWHFFRPPPPPSHGMSHLMLDPPLPPLSHHENIFLRRTEKTSPSAYMVRLYVNVQFQVKPLSTGISSSRTKKKIFQKCLHGPPKVCTKFGVSSTSLS